MNIADRLKEGRVLIGITSETKADLLKRMIQILVERGIVANPEQALQEFLEREAKGSTGIGNGIAIPHVRSDQVEDIEFVFANSEVGVDFESLDGEPVHIIFLMLAPAASHGIHIKALARISRILNDEGLRFRLRKAKDADEIVRLLEEREGELE